VTDNAGAFSAFFRWLILFGLCLFGTYVAFDHGLITAISDGDKSGISLVIAAVFLISSVDAGRRAFRLGRETAAASRLSACAREAQPLFALDEQRRVTLREPCADSFHAHQHLLLLAHKTLQHRVLCDQHLLLERLENTLGRGHETGWFIADLMIRLGLLGTVIGFIVMLGSVSDVSSVDLSALQQLLTRMSDGMRIALNTTLTGLAAGILLGFQYRLLDSAVDRLMAEIIELSEVHAAGPLRQLIGA
jgi:biopolymer transport protein ExbB/TolQ